MNDIERLEKTLKALHPCIAIITHEENYVRRLTADLAMNMSKKLLVWSVIDGVRDGMVADSPPVNGTEHPAAGMLYLTKQCKPDTIAVAYDLLEHLGDARTLRVVRELINRFDKQGGTLILVDHNDQIPKSIETYARRFELSMPDEEELENIVRNTLRMFHQENPIQINIGKKAFKTIIRNLRGLTRRQAEQIILDSIVEDRCFDNNDINSILANKRKLLQSDGLLEYVETPADLEEIGGLCRLKHWLNQRQNAVGEEAVKFGISSPRGVLMLGVQGAGKSLCAKAIATAWQRPLLRMDTGALYDQYIGQSEKRLRDALKQAEMMSPIVLWIDEIEKAFASASSRNTDGGLSQRMFGTLLTWMQEHTDPVFLVATANDIEALPAELLRKGRFDEIFFVDLPNEKTRKKIFEIHLRKRDRDPKKYDLDKLAKESNGFSGAEIEQAVLAGLHEAFDKSEELSTEMLLNIVAESPPLSVTMAEAVNDLRTWASGRCVSAD